MRSLSTTGFVLAAGLMLVSCSRDPVKARQEFLASGDQYFAQKNYSEAIIQYRNAVAQDASYGEARAKLAAAYEVTGDYPNALREQVRAADLMPDNVDAQLRAGRLLISAGSFPEAKARADAALAKEPKNVNGLIVLGNALAGLKDLDGAVKQIDAAIEAEPRLTFTYTNLGLLELSRNNRGGAEAAFRRAVETAPQSVEPHLNLANFFWASGRKEDAERELKVAFDLNPKSPESNRALAAYYVTTANPQRAEPFFKTYAEVAPSAASKLGLADFYLALNKTSDAVAVLSSLKEDKDGFAPARLRLAAVSFREGRKPEAQALVDEVLARAPRDEQALDVKAGFALADRRYDETISLADTSLGGNPRALRSQFLRASALALKGSIDESIGAFRKVLELSPESAAARVQLASLYVLKNDGKSAVETIAPVVRALPRQGLPHFILGQGELLLGNVRAAESELLGVAKANPDSPDIQTWLGRLYATKKDNAAARRAFARALELKPASLDALNGLVTLDVLERNLTDAKATLEPRLSAEPKNAGLAFIAGNAYLTLGARADAEAQFKRVIELEPNNINAYGRLGTIYAMQNRLGEALTKFQELASRQESPVSATTMSGIILDMQGNRAEARKQYERALELNANAAVAANNLASHYIDTDGNLDVALRLAETARKGLPDDPRVSDTLGWVYYKKGLTTLAITTLKQAVAQGPSMADAHYHLGLAYAKNGDITNAQRSLEHALRLSASFKGADDAKQVLATLKG